jgi:phospholipid/cholesterol/gamma-HCH transport system permease protein
MGIQSLPLITLSATFVGLALTAQTCIETQKFNAQALAGGLISIGLLRELGPLTVGMAWAARVCALVHEQALRAQRRTLDREWFRTFFVPRYVAAITMCLPLSVYGLVFGFAVACLAAPHFCDVTRGDFLESARLGIKDKDMFVYFIKLGFINPTVAVFCGCAYAFKNDSRDPPSVATALTAMFIFDVALFWIVTSIAFLP